MSKYASRQAFTPKVGETYTNDNGLDYICIEKLDRGYRFQAVKGSLGKWTCDCYGIGIYEDGTIDWDYSNNGYFA